MIRCDYIKRLSLNSHLLSLSDDDGNNSESGYQQQVPAKRRKIAESETKTDSSATIKYVFQQNLNVKAEVPEITTVLIAKNKFIVSKRSSFLVRSFPIFWWIFLLGVRNVMKHSWPWSSCTPTPSTVTTTVRWSRCFSLSTKCRKDIAPSAKSRRPLSSRLCTTWESNIEWSLRYVA